MRQKGQDYEARAVALLRTAGLDIVTCNFNTRGGEIDIVAREGDTLVFVEVRARSNARFCGAAASVDRRKQRRLIHAAQLFLKHHTDAANRPCRFDVIAFEPPQSGAEQAVRWIQGAFTA